MGLSSSQARLLNLTSRMHQIEYNAARIEAMKLQMANESRRVYEDYLEALDMTKIQKKTINADGSLTYVDVANYTDFLTAGYSIAVHGTHADAANDVTEGTTVCVSEDQLKAAVAQIYKDENGDDLDITSALSGANFKVLLQNLINSGDVTLVQGTKEVPADTTGYATFTNTTASITYYFPLETNINPFTDAETSISTTTGLQEVTDEIALKKAEAKYEADMKRIDLKDRKYDTDLSALESERNAIKQEMETLKTVSKDNVERTFKLFS